MPELLLMLYTTGAVNEVYAMFASCLFIIIPWQLLKTRTARMNGMGSLGFGALAFFSFLYVLIGEQSIQGILYYIACPLLAYLAGWAIIDVQKKDAAKVIAKMIFAMLIGYCIHALLNYSINVGTSRNELKDYFTGRFRAATGSGCINTLALSLMAYFIVFGKTFLHKICAVAFGVVALLYAFMLGTRTQFIIFIVVTFVFLAFYLHEKHGRKSVYILVALFSFLTVAVYYLYVNNIAGIKAFYESSNLAARFAGSVGTARSDETRISRVSEGLINLVEHPLGGQRAAGYYHNLWLDIGRISGILPFACMVFYTGVINLHMFRIFKNRRAPIWLRYILPCIYLGIQMNFFVEPVLEGLLNFFLVFTVINGMVECYYAQNLHELRH